MSAVHDNFLQGYSVDGVNRRIELFTEYQDGGEPFEITTVVFSGVIDHYFRNCILPSIVFDIEEVDPEEILKRDKKLIDEGHRIGGWPSFWRESVRKMKTEIMDKQGRMFKISSSYGLDGWVVAESCEFKTEGNTG